MISKRIPITPEQDNYGRLAKYIAAGHDKQQEQQLARTHKKQSYLGRLGNLARHGLRKLSELRLVPKQGNQREKRRPLLLLPSLSRSNRQRNNSLRWRDNQPGNKSLITWAKGVENADDYGRAIQEAQYVQAKNKRAKNAKTYHLVISFRPEDAPKLKEEDYKSIEERFAKVLGLEEHQRHCGVHINTDNVHMHVAYNLIHPQKFVHIEPYRDYVKRDKLCREIEKEYGLAIDNGREQQKDSPALSAPAASIEAHTGEQSFEGFAKEQGKEILANLSKAKSWEDVHNIFAAQGLLIQKRGNGLVVKNRHGKQMTKASTVSRELSLKKLESRFGKYMDADKTKLPESQVKYQSKAIQKSPEQGQLWEQYQQQRAEQKAELLKIKHKWAEYRKKLEARLIGKKSKQFLIKLAKQKEVIERKEYQQQQPATWLDFLRQEAARGNETALAVLRSRKEPVMQERANTGDLDLENQKAEILARTDIQAKTKNTLISHAIMHKVAPEGTKSEISSHGVVIYSLPDGGKVCDTGKSITFSDTAEPTAIAFMQKKWNLRIKKTEKSPTGKTMIVLANGQKLEAVNNRFERPVYKPREQQKGMER